MKRLNRTGILSTLLALFYLCCARLPAWAQQVTAPDTPNAITQVAEGAEHACALTREGRVLCWGGQYGLIGIAPGEQFLPLPTTGITETIASLAAGGYHTCAVTNQGRVTCWGWNNYGVLGGEQTIHKPIVDVATISETVRMVALGNIHTCALTESGGVQCWGWNREGELGNNSDDNSYAPVAVVGLGSGVNAIDAGSYHTCALTAQQEVYCWGMNQFGQLGDGSVTISRTTLVKVSGLHGVSAISVGGYHTCALANGQVQCWGDNRHGQLGDGTTVISRSLPVDVVGLTDVQEVAAYAYHTCARLATGDLRCWGANGYGRLGDGTQAASNSPVAVVGLGGTAVTLAQGGAFNIFVEEYGGDFTCAVLTDGNVQCWGNNLSGQLGDGSGGERIGGAVRVSGLPDDITAIAVGGTHSCALSGAQQLYCWGSNDAGQLGDGTLLDRSTPVSVTGMGVGVTALAAGEDYSCVLTVTGAAKCWGLNGRGALGVATTIVSTTTPITVTGLSSGVTVIAPGVYSSWRHIGNTTTHTCAIVENGVIQCWGGNYRGELGDGTTTDRWQPLAVTGLPAPGLQITAGYGFSCALLASGKVNCWGANADGELGDGTFTSSKTPVETVDLTNPTLLVSGSDHSCAIDQGGQVKCWGVNGEHGQLGDGTTMDRGAPTPVVGLPGRATDLAAGYVHTCALLEDGTIYCWGSNNYRQLGNTFQDWRSLTPVETQRFSSRPIQISGRGHHLCALLQNGQVHCWGANGNGQLGNGGAWRTTPTGVAIQRLYLPLLLR